MIYTLEYIIKEAELIAGHWNGSDERFMDGSGEPRTDVDAEMAREAIEKAQELQTLVKSLEI